MKGWTLLMALLLGSCLMACKRSQDQVKKAYQVEDIILPEGLGGQVGALDFLPDGRLAACFSSGEVMFYDPDAETWQLYAQGLHDPLGMLAISSDTILVMQRPELTRIIDQNKDGRADLYQTMTDAYGLSGNYHEFAYGPVKDAKGNLYIALNAASPNGGVMDEVRGSYSHLTDPHPKQMFSAVPYRGWVMQYTPQGQLLPYASGFRSPNGLLADSTGRLFVTDNQGDWVPTSALYKVEQGQFYGHPASLVWKRGYHRGNPYDIPVAALEGMRKMPVVLFPQGVIANSPSQPVMDRTAGQFGPFEGQLFVGEMNQARIVRVMLEQVDGQLQGACVPFMDGNGLYKGNNRLAFGPDGSLWVGQNDHGWAGHRGIQRISYTGHLPMDLQKMHLTADGFDLTFTLPLNSDSALALKHYQLRHYRYHYSHKYGSDQYDQATDSIASIALSADRKTVSIQLAALQEGMVYELTFNGIVSNSGDKLRNTVVCYTLNRAVHK